MLDGYYTASLMIEAQVRGFQANSQTIFVHVLCFRRACSSGRLKVHCSIDGELEVITSSRSLMLLYQVSSQVRWIGCFT